MRTTLTLRDDLVKEALEATGKKRLSEAVNQVLDESMKRRKRLALFEWLTENPVPHKFAKIKADRRRRKWSS